MLTAAYTIPEFCAAHRISKAHFYNLCARGHGPAVMSAGKRRLVSAEAAAAWRQRMEDRIIPARRGGHEPR
jgi:hypothetical protein